MFKAVDKWILPYFRSVIARPKRTEGPIDILLAVCDHFEPLSPGGDKPHALGVQRVEKWLREYPVFGAGFRDTDGRPPQHSFFFPIEEAHPDFLSPLAQLTADGFGEVEIHLHHRHDSAENLRRTLIEFRNELHKTYGLLGSMPDTACKIHDTGCAQAPDNGQRKTENGQSTNDESPSTKRQASKGNPVFAFIHGNWALCNSRPDGDWCGVNNELSILLEAGCYADLTFPAIPSPCQPKRFCNSIYLCREGGRRSHDRGRRASVGAVSNAEELLMLQGPAALNWKWRKWGILPRIEHADVSGATPPTASRSDLWIRQHIHVAGQPNWVFVKLHTHGCLERNSAVLLGDAMRHTHEYLQKVYNTGDNYRLHYVTAREMANIAFAAMAGKTGQAGNYRNFLIAPPPCKAERRAEGECAEIRIQNPKRKSLKGAKK
jgi:hypothetical protein